ISISVDENEEDLKKFIEKVILEGWLGESHGEVESLFKSLPLMSGSLLGVGLLIIYAGLREQKSAQESISQGSSLRIGLVQGLCLPFRGFSRSGATISMAMLSGVAREAAEDFSFALAVLLTPPVLLLQLLRLSHAVDASQVSVSWTQTLAFGALGMMLSFAAGFMALKWLSSWLGSGKWKYFGFYCVGLSFLVFSLSQFGF
ncbi:MAG: undecaprenyl-diphosphate phosphatase, partial [Bdellovibrionia bacterium]